MFNLTKIFTKKVTTKKQSVNEIIEEIHETFYTEVDRLLAEAKISHSLDTDKQALIDKSRRLESLGFYGSAEVSEAKEEINRLSLLKVANAEKQDLIAAIDYFSHKYPHYKFITEESVKKICAKYNLVYSTISNYIGNTIPEKNLAEMERFKIDENDKAYTCYYNNSNAYFQRVSDIFFVSKKEVDSHTERMSEIVSFGSREEMSRYMRLYFNEAPLEIAAPAKDFNQKNTVVTDFKLKLEIPDPVVLQPVVFQCKSDPGTFRSYYAPAEIYKKYYLVVTAWGLEAADELVRNEKMN